MVLRNDLSEFRHRAAGAVLAALMLLLTGCAVSETSRPETVARPSTPGSMRAMNPFAVSDPGGRVYVSFYGQVEGVGTGLYFTRSLDGGATWLPDPVRIEAAQPRNRRMGFHRLEADGKGNLYLIWSIEYERQAQRWRTSEVRRRHSGDYGATWSETPLVWAPNRLVNYPTARTGTGGELQIVYTAGDAGESGLFFDRTVQGGKSWLPSPIRIDRRTPDPSAEQSAESRQLLPPAWPAIAHDAGGRIYIAWEESRGFNAGIYFNRSLDQGATWLDHDLRLDRSTRRTSATRRPVISADEQGGIYVAWTDSRQGRLDVYLNRSLDMGGGWLTQDARLNPGSPDRGGAWNPEIATDSKGRIYVLWKEVADFGSALLFAASSDRGDAWFLRPRELVSRGQDTQLEGMRLADGGDGHVYAAWADYTSKKQAITFSRSSDEGETWLPHPRQLNADDARSGVRLPRMSADGGGGIYVVWSGDKSGGLHLFMNRSTDHGNTWLPQQVQITR